MKQNNSQKQSTSYYSQVFFNLHVTETYETLTFPRSLLSSARNQIPLKVKHCFRKRNMVSIGVCWKFDARQINVNDTQTGGKTNRNRNTSHQPSEIQIHPETWGYNYMAARRLDTNQKYTKSYIFFMKNMFFQRCSCPIIFVKFRLSSASRINLSWNYFSFLLAENYNKWMDDLTWSKFVANCSWI